MAKPAVVHAGSYGAVLPPGDEAVRAEVARWRDAATISYDVNARPSVTGVGPEVVRRVEALGAAADVVKASDEDLEVLWPGRDVDESAVALLALGPACVVVTRGGSGATWHSASGSGQVLPSRVEVVDTIGAGDTFAAALIDGLWTQGLLGGVRREELRAADDRVWQEVVGWAVRVAAVTVSRAGADPPTRAEVPGPVGPS